PAAPVWWDIEFFPIRQDDESVLIMGRIRPLPSEPGQALPLLPERLMALRQRHAGRFEMGLLQSDVPAMRRLAGQVRVAAQVRAPVLLVGEAGTGKATIARIIHQQSRDRERSFALLDCPRLAGEEVERVLFGDRAGAQRAALGTVYLRQPSARPRDVERKLGEWADGGA